jgi:small subunit ribosomal protein S4
MGDPKFSRRKYDTPSHPWQGERIQAENELLKKYGLKNKREVWKSQSVLRHFRQRARDLQGKVRYKDPQAEREAKELIDRLIRIGLLNPEQATLDDVLAMNIENVLSRRLQTIAYLKGLSYTPGQARQFIVHGHISIGDRKVTIPGYIVPRDEEELIAYNPRSPIANDLHPARPKEEGAAPSDAAPAPAPSLEGGPAELPAAPPAEAPKTDKPVTAPPPEKTAEKPAEKPAEKKAEKLTERQVEKPAEEKLKAAPAVEKPKEKPSDKKAEKKEGA